MLLASYALCETVSVAHGQFRIPEETNQSVQSRVFSDNKGTLSSIQTSESNDSLNMVLRIR